MPTSCRRFVSHLYPPPPFPFLVEIKLPVESEYQMPITGMPRPPIAPSASSDYIYGPYSLKPKPVAPKTAHRLSTADISSPCNFQ